MTYPITGAALANCLGSDSDTVFARAFAGDAAFVPAASLYNLGFATAVGVIAEPTLHDDLPWPLTCARTRVASIVLGSARQIQPAVATAAATWGPRRVGYVFASSTGGLEATERMLAPDPSLPIGPGYRYANHCIDATSTAVANYFGIAGVTLAISTACSSGIHALNSAIRLIDRDLCDAAVVGSADSLSRITLCGFHSLGLTAPSATRPFSTDRAGITLGEGSAFVLIERRDTAAIGRAIAWLAGTGSASDAYHHTSPHPEGLGGQLAMREALARAALGPGDISYVSAHGTGTPHNDAAEASAVRRVFARDVPLTANKSLVGHTLGTAGLTGVVLAIESLRRQVIPPTLRLSLDETLGVRVVGQAEPAAIDHVLVNAFGFGGSNSAAVISRQP